MKTLTLYLLSAVAVVFGSSMLERSLSSKPGGGLPAGHTIQHAVKTTSMTSTRAIVVAAKWTSPDTCAFCHEDQVTSFKSTTHAHSWKRGQACEQCHGDATHHLETGGAAGTIQTMKNLSSNEVSATCLTCHERPGEQAHGKLSEHFRAGIGCTNCHDVHPSPEHGAKMHAEGKTAMLKGKQTELCLSCHSTVNSDLNKPTHHRLKEGVMECSSCHNPHGSTYDHQLRADTKTLCINCHQDKRGPFVYEHNAQAIDGCMACHESHGSGSRNMLKDRDPRTLCISCHSKEAAIGVPHSRGNFSLQTSGDCTRCHSEIHGSNRSEYFIN